MENFSQNLARMMAERGINQPELAHLSGVDQSLISRYLRSDKKAKLPNLNNLVALAKALNCTLENLAGVEIPQGRLEKDTDPQRSSEQIALLEAYEKLPEGHWLKIMIKQELLNLRDL